MASGCSFVSTMAWYYTHFCCQTYKGDVEGESVEFGRRSAAIKVFARGLRLWYKGLRAIPMGEKFGKYELIRKIAVGGMAEIFLATYTGPEGFKKHVAIKRILPHLTEDSDFVTMFLDEARLVARFSHPNIVQIFELGQVKNVYFLAMEYVHGASMSRLLKACKKRKIELPVELGAKICSYACDGLEYAHNFTDPDGTPLNLIHRDVSPQNIMLSYDGVVKVLDFGIAKAAGNLYRTRTTSLKGKAAYMSPEQITQKSGLDRRSDIFAMGIVLYEFTTGHRPFQGDTELELMMAIVQSEPPDPRKYKPRLPQRLVDIIMTALKKDRRQRFQSAREMKSELEKLLLEQDKIVDSYDLANFIRRAMPPSATPVGYAVPTPSRPSIADQIEEALREAEKPKRKLKAVTANKDSLDVTKPSPDPVRTAAASMDAAAEIDAPTVMTPSEQLRPLIEKKQKTPPAGVAAADDKMAVQIAGEESVRGAGGIRLKSLVVAAAIVLVAAAGALGAYLVLKPPPRARVIDARSVRVEQRKDSSVAGSEAENVTDTEAGTVPEGKQSPAGMKETGGTEAAGLRDSTVHSGPHKVAGGQGAGESMTRGSEAKVADGSSPPAEQTGAGRKAYKPHRKRSQRRRKTSRVAREKVQKPGKRSTPPAERRQESKVASALSMDGRLMVFSRPWVNVRIDGVSYGATPLDSPISLKAGQHLVELSNPDGIRYREKVYVAPGKTISLKKRFGKGFLRVFVKPFGDVYVNGKKKGQTPLDGPLELYEGKHVLRVFCTKTGKEFTKTIVVRPGQTITEKIDLR